MINPMRLLNPVRGYCKPIPYAEISDTLRTVKYYYQLFSQAYPIIKLFSNSIGWGSPILKSLEQAASTWGIDNISQVLNKGINWCNGIHEKYTKKLTLTIASIDLGDNSSDSSIEWVDTPSTDSPNKDNTLIDNGTSYSAISEPATTLWCEDSEVVREYSEEYSSSYNISDSEGVEFLGGTH